MTLDMITTIWIAGLQLLKTLAGPFVGAWIAFALQNSREQRKRTNERYEAIIRVQHAIYFMWLILARIRYDYLDEHKGKAERHRELGILWAPDHRVPIEFSALAFLHQPNFRNLLTNMFMAERAYISAIEALKDRNDKCAKIAEQKNAAFNPGTKRFDIEIDSATNGLLKLSTDALYTSVDTGMGRCQQAFADLRKAAKTIFPKRSGFLKDDNLSREGFLRAHGASDRDRQVIDPDAGLTRRRAAR